jgi:hypothetical protein
VYGQGLPVVATYGRQPVVTVCQPDRNPGRRLTCPTGCLHGVGRGIHVRYTRRITGKCYWVPEWLRADGYTDVVTLCYGGP